MAKKTAQVKPLTVVEDERGPEVIAKAIEQTATAAQKLLEGGLTRRALVLLIHDAIPGGGYGNPKPSKTQVADVLDAAAGLRKYVSRKP